MSARVKQLKAMLQARTNDGKPRHGFKKNVAMIREALRKLGAA